MYKLYTFVGKALGIKLAGKGNLVLFMKGLLLIRTLKNVQLKDSQGNGLFVLFLWGEKSGGVPRKRRKMGCSTGRGEWTFQIIKLFKFTAVMEIVLQAKLSITWLFYYVFIRIFPYIYYIDFRNPSSTVNTNEENKSK